MDGFGTHNFWTAFRGWLGAKIYGAPVKWTTVKSKHLYDWHVVKVGDRWS